ncbi:hypothetical protein DL768_000823 [Monosporascus sp. mg162]|nr:hypothetical protein DL768_000823 [Monosporascus sp. mg162]
MNIINNFPNELLVEVIAHLKRTGVLSLMLTFKHLREMVEHQRVLENQLLRNHCGPAVFQMAAADDAAKVTECRVREEPSTENYPRSTGTQ